MILTSFLLLTGMCAAPTLENAMPVRVTGPWTIAAGPGKIVVGDQELNLAEAVSFDVQPADVVHIRDEVYSALPVFNKDAAGWCKGARLRGLLAEECSATGLLFPDSVRIKLGLGAAEPFAQGKDYEIDPFWATFGRVDGGAIAARQSVFIDYDYAPSRLDTIAVDKSGKARLVRGKTAVALLLPPELNPGEMAVVNVYVPGRIEKLSDENLFPIEFKPSKDVAKETVAEKLLPKTLAKLRAGEPVTIVAFGDSVTDGGGVGAHNELWYQNQFLVLLQERFPKAKIRMLTAGWGGASSNQYLTAPKGGPYDFARDVLDPKPDLVTIEFVNDAYFDEAGVAKHYAKILELIRGVGGEVALITPHLVRPDWMTPHPVNSMKFDDDPRPYVKGLKKFGAENNVAVADASAGWCRLWRQGIPYITLLANDINHPDGRGHAIFARALIGLFPENL